MQFRIVIIIILNVFYVIFYKISGENLAKIGKKKKKKKLDNKSTNWTYHQKHLLFRELAAAICY